MSCGPSLAVPSGPSLPSGHPATDLHGSLLAGFLSVKRTPDAPELALGDLGVELSGAYARVSQQLLDEPHVRAPLEKVRSEAVAKDVGGEGLGDSGPPPRSLARTCSRRELARSPPTRPSRRNRRAWPRYALRVWGA